MNMEKETTGRVLMHRYEVGRLLGKGAFAKVYYARSIAAGQSVAIKVIDKEKIMKAGLVDQIKREVSVMRLVRHPNIVQLYEVMASKSKIYFVLEYVKGGELFGKVARGRLREDVARKYFQQLISAVDFCHSRGVYHRDLKPENLLLDERGNLKVSDFGLSALAVSVKQDGLLHTTCGTPAYVAPEVIARKGYDGSTADIWSCGVILFVLLAGYLPFQSPNLMDMYRKIARGEFRCPHWFSSYSRRLLSRILDPNPSSRIPIANILENTWFQNPKAKQQEDVVDGDEEKHVGAGGGGGDGENTIQREEEHEKPAMLNAFDIISLSSGFHLSSLFEEGGRKGEAIFTSNQPPEAIMAKLEETARGLKLKVKTKERGSLKLEGSDARRKVVLEIDVEIFEVTPMFHVVEVKKTDGDTYEYERLWRQGIRPALEEIGWAWDSD